MKDCKNCGKQTTGTSVMHPMFDPPMKYFDDICFDCINSVVDSMDWSIEKVLTIEND